MFEHTTTTNGSAEPREHYRRSRLVRGSELSPGMWLYLADRIGACAIKSIEIPGPDGNTTPLSHVRRVQFWYDEPFEISADERHLVVDPNSSTNDRPRRRGWLMFWRRG